MTHLLGASEDETICKYVSQVNYVASHSDTYYLECLPSSHDPINGLTWLIPYSPK